jgi:hypothetical protein
MKITLNALFGITLMALAIYATICWNSALNERDKMDKGIHNEQIAIDTIQDLIKNMATNKKDTTITEFKNWKLLVINHKSAIDSITTKKADFINKLMFSFLIK